MFRAVAPERIPAPVQGPDAGSVRMLGDRLGMKEGGFRDLPFGAEGFGGQKGRIRGVGPVTGAVRAVFAAGSFPFRIFFHGAHPSVRNAVRG